MRWLGPALSVLLLGAAIWVLDDVFATIAVADVVAAFNDLSAIDVSLAFVFTALSYLTLMSYDRMAVSHVGKDVALGRIALTSFTSNVFAHNVGFGVITSSSVRYRMYGSAGLSAVDIAAISIFCWLAFALGVFSLSGVALLAEPDAVLASIPSLPVWLARTLGVACLGAVVAYLLCCALLDGPVNFRGAEFRLPSLKLSIGQLGFSILDLTFAAAAMYVLIPQTAEITLIAFIGAYVLAILVGAVSNLPGGLGVFEVAMVLLLPNEPPQAVLAAALAYRIIYYLVPFAVAVLLVVGAEIAERRQFIGTLGKTLGGLLVRFAPQLSGIFVLLAGTVLLVSGVNPAAEERLEPLSDLLPLTVVEASHLLGSVVGVGLLILARGLMRRLDAAYYLAIPALAAGIILSLLKGLDYEEAIVLTIVLALVVFSRRAFYRQTPILASPFTPGWLVMVALIIATSTYIGFFVYRHVEYSHDLWWTFAVDADAPRFLRAQMTVTVLALILAGYLIMRPTKPLPNRPTNDELQAASDVIAKVRSTDVNLALLGDKQLLFNEKRDGFVMYATQGGSLIALGDPVSARDEVCTELAWAFRELCDEHDKRTVFYQVSEDRLPLYIDMGLSLQKLGEEAMIALADFSLEGSKRRDLRQSHTRAVREGLRFEIVPANQVNAILPELRSVSDSWLSEKSTREKSFSVGSFSDAYISRFPCAVVRAQSPDGSTRIVGFANLWLGGDHHELSLDLMRHTDDAPYGVMDFLFVEVMLWGRAQGFAWFNLGLAPLAGLENHSLAPIWHRAGAFIFRHGENFYNFEGLRRYKAKFNPEWRAKYLATRSGLNVAAALFDVSTLISGGLRGLVAK